MIRQSLKLFFLSLLSIVGIGCSFKQIFDSILAAAAVAIAIIVIAGGPELVILGGLGGFFGDSQICWGGKCVWNCNSQTAGVSISFDCGVDNGARGTTGQNPPPPTTGGYPDVTFDTQDSANYPDYSLLTENGYLADPTLSPINQTLVDYSNDPIEFNGDPINTFSGKSSANIMDFSYHRTGFPIQFERFYNEDMPAAPLGNLGTRWMSNYDWSLVLSEDTDKVVNGNIVVLIKPNHVYSFTLNGDGITYSPSDHSNFFRLARVGMAIPGTGTLVGGVLTVASYQNVSTGTGFLDGRMNATQLIPGQRFQLTDKFGNKYYLGTWGSMSENVAALIGVEDKNLN